MSVRRSVPPARRVPARPDRGASAPETGRPIGTYASRHDAAGHAARRSPGPRRATSTASCRCSTSRRACSRSPRTRRVPLLERAKFLAIFSGNLDEFFQVRVAGLKEQLAAGVRSTSPDGLDQVEQLRAIRARVEELVTRQAAAFTKDIAPALAEAGRRVHRLARSRRRRARGAHARVRGPDLPGAHAARRRPRASRSRTSPTSRSTSRSSSATRRPARSASRA